MRTRTVRGVAAIRTILGLAVLLSGGIAAAQDRQPTRIQDDRAPRARQDVPIRAAPAQTIPVLRISPQAEAAPQLPDGSILEAKPAAPLTTEAKLKALTPPEPPSGAGDIQKAPDPKLTSIKLSAKNPYAHNRGYLTFNEVRHADTSSDYVMWYYPQNSGMGFVQARLNLEKGKRYLADMNVSCSEEQTFHYGSQTVTVQEGSHHLLVILEPQGSGWTTLTLWNDKSWAFYTLEVTVQE
jgi:hypothetical protein